MDSASSCDCITALLSYTALIVVLHLSKKCYPSWTRWKKRRKAVRCLRELERQGVLWAALEGSSCVPTPKKKSASHPSGRASGLCVLFLAMSVMALLCALGLVVYALLVVVRPGAVVPKPPFPVGRRDREASVRSD